MKLQRITVGIKPWDRSLPFATQHARSLTRAADARIELVSSVFDAAIGAGCERGEDAARRARERAVAAARVELERLAATLRPCDAAVTTRVVWGAPAYEAIVEAAQESRADLLVVGAHERATLHSRLTDTDWQLMRRTPCPLLLVKNARFSPYRSLLAAVDCLGAGHERHGSEPGVLATSRCVARAFGCGLRVAYADCGSAKCDSDVLYGSEAAGAPRRNTVTRLAIQLDIAASEIDVLEGSSPRAIVDLAAQRRADLIAVGGRPPPGVTSAALGFVAELVAGDAPCDVLIVPAHEWDVAASRRSQVG